MNSLPNWLKTKTSFLAIKNWSYVVIFIEFQLPVISIKEKGITEHLWMINNNIWNWYHFLYTWYMHCSTLHTRLQCNFLWNYIQCNFQTYILHVCHLVSISNLKFINCEKHSSLLKFCCFGTGYSFVQYNKIFKLPTPPPFPNCQVHTMRNFSYSIGLAFSILIH